MTHTQATPLAAALDPTTLAALLRATLDTLPHHPDASEDERATDRQAALIAITALAPRGPMEAMLAARYVAAHHAVMAAFRGAAQPNLPATWQLRYQGRAIALSRLMDAAMRDLSRLQARASVRPIAQPPAMPAPRPQRPPAAPPPVPARSAPPVRNHPTHRDSAAAAAAAAPSGAPATSHAAVRLPDPALDRMLSEVAARAAASLVSAV